MKRGRRDGSSERVEGRGRIGWLKPSRPSNGDGHRAGVAALRVLTKSKGPKADGIAQGLRPRCGIGSWAASV